MTDTIDNGQEIVPATAETPLMPVQSALQPAGTPQFTFKQIIAMAGYVAQAGLYGVKTLEQTISIMLLAQASGQHPVLAARDYHILTFTDKKTGRPGCMPTLKADVILGRFLEAGGKIEYLEYTAERVSMTFEYRGTKTLPIIWDIERAQTAELLSNPLYSKYPQQMFKARCIGEGVKMVCPQVLMGTYTTEEAVDFLYEDIEPVAPALKQPLQLKNAAVPTEQTEATEPPNQTPPQTEQEKDKGTVIPPQTEATETKQQKATFFTDTMQKFKADCRELFSKVKAKTIDTETGRRHYFVYCEDLTAAGEAVPADVETAAQNILYGK